MGLFRYEAVDRAGKVLHGAMNAANEQQVAQALAQKGYSVRAVHAAGAVRTVAATSAPARQQSAPQPVRAVTAAVRLSTGVPVSVKSVIPASTLAVFFRQLITLVRAGIPLYQSFHDIVHTTSHRRLRSVLVRVQEGLQSGNALSSAMAQHPNVFPVHAVASVWAGELGGKLEKALEEIAVDFEQEARETRTGRIGWGMAKLNLISFLLVIWAANLEELAGPTILAGIKRGTSSHSEVLASLARAYLEIALKTSIPIVIVLIAIWIGWGYLKRVAAVRRLLDGLLLMTPVWGHLHRCRALSRFVHVLEQNYEAGLSPSTCWDSAALTPRNSAVAERLKFAPNMAPAGAGLAELFAAAGLFQPEDSGIVSAGEKGGQVPSALSSIAASYADRAESQRLIGRTLSISILASSIIALSGWVMIRMVKSYFDLMFGVGEKLTTL